MMRRSYKKGFTIVELLLSMTFLATLLITIALLTIHITTIYEKGLSIKAVNSVGRELIDEFTRAVASSPILPVTNRDSYFKQNTTDPNHPLPQVNDDPNANISFNGTAVHPTNGVFCTGLVSYIWNTGYAINEFARDDTTNFRARYRVTASGTESSDFYLLRVQDATRSVCTQYSNNDSSVGVVNQGQLNPLIILEEEPLQILTSDGQVDSVNHTSVDLALYDFRVFPATQNRVTGQTFYSATFILATLRGGVNIFSQGNYCTAPPDNLNTDFAFCAINKFNFAMRATGFTDDDGYGQRKL